MQAFTYISRRRVHFSRSVSTHGIGQGIEEWHFASLIAVVTLQHKQILCTVEINNEVAFHKMYIIVNDTWQQGIERRYAEVETYYTTLPFPFCIFTNVNYPKFKKVKVLHNEKVRDLPFCQTTSQSWTTNLATITCSYIASLICHVTCPIYTYPLALSPHPTLTYPLALSPHPTPTYPIVVYPIILYAHTPVQ